MTKTIIAIAVTAAAYLIAGDTDGAHCSDTGRIERALGTNR